MKEVTERDLFNYIYYPDTLSEEIFNFIKQNQVKFKKELDLLSATKKSQNENVPEEILEKIHLKINAIENRKIVKLFKEKSAVEKGEDYLVLAAESPTLERIIQTETFKDEDSHYLIKVISDKEFNKIFIFSQDNSELKDFTITLEPSGDSYNVETSSKPFIVRPRQNIERISLVTNN